MLTKPLISVAKRVQKFWRESSNVSTPVHRIRRTDDGEETTDGVAEKQPSYRFLDFITSTVQKKEAKKSRQSAAVFSSDGELLTFSKMYRQSPTFSPITRSFF